MRPVLPGDLAAAGCALLALPANARVGAIHRMLLRANLADRHRIATGRAHKRWGNGSLGAVAMAMTRAGEPVIDDPEYLDCLMTVLAGLKAMNR